ncbi:MAG: FAD-binding oxidoreductase [Paracoccaceae bacterium]|nr:FAD-binding oxidoreductase [Paracoccaceae bacterium]
MNLLTANDRPGQYPASWYAATATPLGAFARLEGAERADVCVIGGGFTGLSAALHLAEAGLSVILLEAHRVGFGASGRNGGQVGSGQRLEQDTLEKTLGRDDARKLWDMGEEAKALIRDLIARHAMPVTFHEGVAHACWRMTEVGHAHAYAEKLARDYGYDRVQTLDRTQMAELTGTEVFAGGDLDRGAGHVHPLNFALGLARAAADAGVRIFERSEVTALTESAPHLVKTEAGMVMADHVVLACNGYLGHLFPEVAARVMPINNFIIATEPLGPMGKSILPGNPAVADTKFVVNYWRKSEDGRLLFGGSETYGYRFPADIAALVRKPLSEVYPQLRDVKIDYAWGGTLAITMNRMPCFFAKGTILSASGYSGHGVAMATLAGRVLAEAIAGQAGRFDLLAKLPMPRFPGGPALRTPLLVLAMTWFSLRDKIGI